MQHLIKVSQMENNLMMLGLREDLIIPLLECADEFNYGLGLTFRVLLNNLNNRTANDDSIGK